ncbi:MAG TPA: DUF6508 domain-containing protein [Lachnospiraceae bacterium]|nr:DUF6508 domain-containing protein [Lachnospiraceae bacterium]
MEQDLDYRHKLVRRIKPEVEPLFRYLPWLEAKEGQMVSSTYTANDVSTYSIPFPVYDSTLLSFIKEVQKSSLTDKNYVYIYTRHRMKTTEEERAHIENVTITNLEILTGVLSKYILGGMTKGWVWSQAVQDGIFLAILRKFQTLFELWDQPEVKLGKQE